MSPALVALPFLAVALTAAPAKAAFSVCNRTQHAAHVALGYYDGLDWSSSGWWTVEAGACARLIGESLQGRFYYLYAEHAVGGAWDGEHSFCIATGRFNIQGRGACAAQGFRARKFFEVDTGRSSDWTENLSE